MSTFQWSDADAPPDDGARWASADDPPVDGPKWSAHSIIAEPAEPVDEGAADPDLPTPGGGAVATRFGLVDSARLVEDGYPDLVLTGRRDLRLHRLHFGHPASREDVAEVAGMSGVDDRTVFHGASAVTAAVRIVGGPDAPPAVLAQALRAWCMQDRRPRLRYTLVGLGEREAPLVGADADIVFDADQPIPVAATLAWRNPRGVHRTAAPSRILIRPDQPKVGFTFPFTMPLTLPYGIGTGSVTATVDRDGGVADPVITIYGPCDDPAITNEATGRTLAFTDLTLASGDWLTIDTRRRTAQINGSDDLAGSRRSLMTSRQWWLLGRGDNAIRFHPASNGDGCVAEVAWHPTWP